MENLYRLTAGLAPLLDEVEIAAYALEVGVEAVGGQTGSLCLLDPVAEELVIVAQRGYAGEVVEAWTRFPLDANLPASECVRTCRPVFIRDAVERDERYPAFRRSPVTTEAAHAILPLMGSEGQCLGALVMSFGEGRSFTAGERHYMETFAGQCAIAIERARLHAEVAAARDRFEFLEEASRLLGSSLDVEATLHQLAVLAVPRIADWCVIYQRRDDEVRFVVGHRDPRRERELQDVLASDQPDLDAPTGVGAVLRTGERELRAGGSELTLPVLAHGRVWGAVTIAKEEGAALSPIEIDLAGELASRASTAVANAELFEDRSRIARALQASLLPPTMPDIPGVALAARYLPAGSGTEVGGDFYDVFQVAPGQWLMAIGDVRGKGVEAAVVTGLARHTIRSAALEGRPVQSILRHVNEVLLHGADSRDVDPSGPQFCTVLLCELRTIPEGVHAVVCSAGHPLPRRLGPDGVTEVGLPGTVLGVLPDLELHEMTVVLPPGATLVAVTDGVLERRSGNEFFDESLDAVLASLAGESAEDIVEKLEKAVLGFDDSALADDLAILAVRALP